MTVTWIGQTLNGRYRIDELTGQGGMSAVYKAWDPNLRRVVAIKMIHSHLSGNPDFIRRFEEEAAAVAQLRHPNIVQVYDFSHDNGVYYMVLEFLPGETLQSRLERLNSQKRRLPISDAIDFISQVGEAAQYAHDRSMIHRDIKPANIMLDVYGHAILMDFGIARIVGGQLHTATGAVVGTAMYMSPEQIVGERADERSDIYSLGVTLFETISGRPPFESDSAMTLMMMHMNDPVPDLRELTPDVPYGLVRVVEKALEKKRDKRFQTMKEMVAALRAVQQLAGQQAQPEQRIASGDQVDSSDKADAGDQAGPGNVITLPLPPVDVPAEKATAPGMAEPGEAAPSAASAPVSGEPPAPPAQEKAELFTGNVAAAPKNPAVRSEPAPRSGPSSDNVTAADAVRPGQVRAGAARRGGDDLTMDDPLPRSTRVVPMQYGVPPAQPAQPRQTFLLGAVVMGLGVIAIIAILMILSRAGAVRKSLHATQTAQASQTVLVAGVESTATPDLAGTQAAQVREAAARKAQSQTEQAKNTSATAAAQAAATVAPIATETAPVMDTPTPTIPPGVQYYARINRITAEAGVYVVDYETFEFVEESGSLHVHFFYDTVKPQDAGAPGEGPWVMYSGPRPFQGLTVASRPAQATRLCVLVANVNHTVRENSGNCMDLP